MAILEIEVTGQQELTLKLTALLAPELVQGILDDATASLLGRIRARYLDKVDPDSKPWEPSRAGLLRESHGGPGTLFDTGHLFHSIQEAVVDPATRVIATDVFYAPFMQFGYQINTKDGISSVVPPRTFLGIGEEDQHVIEVIIASRVQRALGGLSG